MRRAAWVAAVLPLLAAGCAGALRVPGQVDLATDCAASLAALPARQLAAPGPAGDRAKPAPTVDFAEVAGCVETPAGRTAAALWTLPDAPDPALVRIEIPAAAVATFAARVALLDAEYRVVEEWGFESFARRGHAYTFDVFPHASRSARYLLLTPDPSQVGNHDRTVAGQTNTMVVPVGTAALAYNVGTEAVSVRSFTQGGWLRIQAHPLE